MPRRRRSRCTDSVVPTATTDPVPESLPPTVGSPRTIIRPHGALAVRAGAGPAGIAVEAGPGTLTAKSLKSTVAALGQPVPP